MPVEGHVQDALGGRPAQRLGGHVDHALQVLVVDRLVDARGPPTAQLGEGRELPRRCP